MSPRIGKFLLRRKIGAGGMGEVWEAEDTVLDRRVAVKVLTGDGADQAEYIREAAAAARVNHPNAVTLYDAAKCDGRWVIVMEYVAGPDLGRLVADRGRLLWAEATRIARDAAAGLAAVHAAGLVHRDVKPGNVLIAADGAAKVADFGLARGALRSAVTKASGVVGTPHFMSPEQCWNEVADARADVYSLGATFYTLLTGRPPYHAGTELAIMYAHCNSPVPDPAAVVPDLPSACVAIVRRAMAKAPADRYQTADALRAALDAALTGIPDAAPPPPVSLRLPPNTAPARAVDRPRPTRRAVLALLPIAVAGVGAAAYFGFRRGDRDPLPPIASRDWAERWETGGSVYHLGIAPDGGTIAVAVTATGPGAEGGVELRTRDGQAVAGWPRPGAGAEAVAFAPDGKSLAAAYRVWQRVQVWDVASGRVVPVEGGEQLPDAVAVAFSADGETLAAGSYAHDGARIRFWRADGPRGWKRTHEFTAGEGQIWGFAPVPGTNLLAVTTADGREADARASITILNMKSGVVVPGPDFKPERVQIGPGLAVAASAPVLAVASRGEVRRFSIPDWRPIGAPISFAPGDLYAIAISPDGKLLAGARDAVVLVWQVVGGPPAEYRGHDGVVQALAFAPDGRLLSGGADGRVCVHNPVATG